MDASFAIVSNASESLFGEFDPVAPDSSRAYGSDVSSQDRDIQEDEDNGYQDTNYNVNCNDDYSYSNNSIYSGDEDQDQLDVSPLGLLRALDKETIDLEHTNANPFVSTRPRLRDIVFDEPPSLLHENSSWDEFETASENGMLGTSHTQHNNIQQLHHHQEQENMDEYSYNDIGDASPRSYATLTPPESPSFVLDVNPMLEASRRATVVNLSSNVYPCQNYGICLAQATVNVPLHFLFDLLFSDDIDATSTNLPLKHVHEHWNSSVGSIKTFCKEDQILLSSIENGHILIKARITMPNLPYGAAFSVNISYCLATATACSSRLQLFGKVDFSKAVLLEENITSTAMDMISEFATLFQQELMVINNCRQADAPLLRRSNTKRPGGPRSEPISVAQSPMCSKPSSPSPSAPSPVRHENGVVRPIQTPLSASPVSKHTCQHTIVSSTFSNSSTRLNSQNTLESPSPHTILHPFASTPTTATVGDEDSQTVYSGKLNPEGPYALDSAEMFDNIHSQQQPAPFSSSTSHRVLLDPQYFRHPSKRTIAVTTLIQPIRSPSKGSIATTPTRSAISSPLVSLASVTSSSVSSPSSRRKSSGTLTPAIAPAAESHYHDWNGHNLGTTSYNNAAVEIEGGQNGSGGKDKLIGPRPIAPPRVKFRQTSSRSSDSATASVVSSNNSSRGGGSETTTTTTTVLQHQNRRMSLEQSGSSSSLQYQQQQQPDNQYTTLASKEYNPFELRASGSVTAVLSNSKVVVVEKRSQQQVQQLQSTPTAIQPLLTEIKNFGHGSLRKRGGVGSGNMAVDGVGNNNVASTSKSSAASITSTPILSSSSSSSIAPPPSTKGFVKRHKELPTKVGYRVKMPGHWIREFKPTPEYMAENYARRLWLENLKRNSLTGMVTPSLLVQLVVIAMVCLSGGDLWIMLEWWREAWKIVVFVIQYVILVGGRGLNDAFGRFGQWAAGQLGFVRVVKA
ncbi:UNVERIFIED_CONTAM: hypothetical protein HDU68_011839 [Siphonaria sp. JEL0065]|nr:hypothetical protein HDU68_011839 [Siphonaria sp. JEL0065]